jgi:hypothetical protein
MSLSSLAYSQYLSNKIFLHAKSIYSANTHIKLLLEEHSGLIPEEIEQDCVLLLNHYTIWMNQFEDLSKSLNPSPETVFVFNRLDDNGSFPGESVHAILRFVDNYKIEI